MLEKAPAKIKEKNNNMEKAGNILVPENNFLSVKYASTLPAP
jgi:hypothetical protein